MDLWPFDSKASALQTTSHSVMAALNMFLI